ncbi:MAG: hypothetical protein ACRD36_02995 [Candidatus Acidiferrum sp.]
MIMKVGDQIFIVEPRQYEDSSKTYTLAVEKIGRAWATLGDGSRVNLKSMELENSRGRRIFSSEEAWKLRVKTIAAWGHLRDFMRNKYYAPKDATLSQVLNACRALGAGDPPSAES